MLTSRILVRPAARDEPPDPEDIFVSAIGLLFTDDHRTQHGDRGALVVYRSAAHGDVELRVAEPEGEEERTKFAHYLWNAGILMAELVGGSRAKWWRREDGGDGIERDGGCGYGEGLVKGERVLELGAGVGLGGIISALAGAELVTITDYPSSTILSTLSANAAKNIPAAIRPRVTVQGHQWGDLTSEFSIQNAHRYTWILAADCLWMEHEHASLLRSMAHFLALCASARVLVVAGFHTGREIVAAFFADDALAEVGLEMDRIWEVDVDGRRREWKGEGAGLNESLGEKRKWFVVALLRWRTCDGNIGG